MGPLIDAALEKVDKQHAQLTQLSSDLVDAMNLYHMLMREPAISSYTLPKMPPQQMVYPYPHQQGHPQAGPPQGVPPQGVPPQGHPQAGHPHGVPPQGHPQAGHPHGVPPQGHPQAGHPQAGHPHGVPPQGHPQPGHPQGVPPQGAHVSYKHYRPSYRHPHVSQIKIRTI